MNMELYVHLDTTQGEMVARLLRDEVPAVVRHFLQLATGAPPWLHPGDGRMHSDPFYRDMPIVAAGDGIVQTGCWRGDGTGFIPPAEPYEDPPTRSHVRGAVSMARAGFRRYGAQFFICTMPMPHLDPLFTVFAILTEGHDVLDRLTTADRLIRTWVEEF